MDEKALEGGGLFMNHYTYHEWYKYVKGERKQNKKRLMDKHLYTCDHCLNLYLQAVEELEHLLPDIINQDYFTDEVMSQVSEIEGTDLPAQLKSRTNRRPVYQSVFFHYAIAVAMTILLMTTGVFQTIFHYADNVQKNSFQPKETSITVGLVDKTFTWIDSLKDKRKVEAK